MSDGQALASRLNKEIDQLRSSVADANSAFENGALHRGTRDDVVELTLVRALGLFEEFTGDLFYLALQSRLGSEVTPTIPAKNREDAVRIVAGADAYMDSKYVSWMPFQSKTMPRARELLSNGSPFNRLSTRSPLRNLLADLTIVRNRIAHDSQVARHKFETAATKKGYPHSRAADYLVSRRGQQTEIELGLTVLDQIAKGVALPRESESREILGPEDPFSERTLAPPGSYRCKRFDHLKQVEEYSMLGSCAECPPASACHSCGKRQNADTLWVRLE